MELIVQYYKLPIDKLFTSSDLLNVIRQTKWLVDVIDTTKVIDNELSLYRNTYRPKWGKIIHCFYAAPRGGMPQGESASIRTWNTQIDNADDLKGKKLLEIKKT
jgi:hypothetical protein